MREYRVEIFGSTLMSGHPIVRNIQSKGYRGALRKLYHSTKPNFKAHFGGAIWVRVTDLTSGKTLNYFVKLGKRGKILKIE